MSIVTLRNTGKIIPFCLCGGGGGGGIKISCCRGTKTTPLLADTEQLPPEIVHREKQANVHVHTVVIPLSLFQCVVYFSVIFQLQKK